MYLRSMHYGSMSLIVLENIMLFLFREFRRSISVFVKGWKLGQCGFRFTIKPGSYWSKCVVIFTVEIYPPTGGKGSMGTTQWVHNFTILVGFQE